MELKYDTNRAPGSTVVRDLTNRMLGMITKVKEGQRIEGKQYLYVNLTTAGPAAILGDTYDEVKGKVADLYKDQ